MTRDEAIAAALPIPGWMSEAELGALYDLATCVPEGQAVVELGSYCGRSTTVLAAAAPHAVCAVDAFNASTVSDSSGVSGDEAAFRRNMDAYDVGLLKMDVAQAGRGWRGGPVGLLLLDASHDYQATRDALVAWLPHVPAGGVVAFHDYTPAWPGVKRVVDEVAPHFGARVVTDTLWWGAVTDTTCAQVMGMGVDKPVVMWFSPAERMLYWECHASLVGVAVDAFKRNYHMIGNTYGATDDARNGAVATFVNYTGHPDSWLVMLDVDHIHPSDIVHRLVTACVRGVVGAAYRRRGADPGDILARVRDADGRLVDMAGLTMGAGQGPVPVAWVGTGAMAIQRWVFDALRAAGYGQPYFEYEYERGKTRHVTEDVTWCEKCERAGVPVYLHAGVYTTHVFLSAMSPDGDSLYQVK